MRRLVQSLVCLLTTTLFACGGAPLGPAPAVDWQPWSAETFATAARDGRYLLVSVQAGWCHWCHVMNDETFGDHDVRRLLGESYVAIKVDSDARPDLAERFRDYAWPATVLLTPRAEVVVALRGYRGPEPFAALLRKVRVGAAVADVDEPRTSAPPADLTRVRDAGRAQLDAAYDPKTGGWGRDQKYPYFGPLEHALFRARDVDLARVRQTVDGTQRLIDPEFGGAYQYSLKRRWDRPHYEKIAAVQADVLAALAAYALVEPAQAPAMRTRMAQVTGYLAEFMTDAAGGFYTSQDADLSHSMTGDVYYAKPAAERRALGIPRVDQHVYTDLNGRLIVALVWAHRAGAPGTLDMALRAMQAVAPRLGPAGYAHGGVGDAGLVYLRDQAWMLRAALALHAATGDRQWRDAAAQTAARVESLRAPGRGYYAHSKDPAAAGVFADRRAPIVENGVLARGLLQLHRLTGDDALLAAAEHALRAGDAAVLKAEGRRGGEYLMALEELSSDYVTVSVVGEPSDPAARELHRAGFELQNPRRLVDRSTPAQSEYPFPGHAVAYLCNAARCSQPVKTVEALRDSAATFFPPR